MITQQQALKRMETEARKDMRALEDSYNDKVAALWKSVCLLLKFQISFHYRNDFSKGEWDINGAYSKGTFTRIQIDTAHTLENFKRDVTRLIASALSHIKEEECLRALWMLDQITPDGFMPKASSKLHEAVSPGDSKASWAQALAVWADAYHKNLNTNLRLEALHEGSVDDAAQEVDATRVDNYELAYKLKSLFSTQALVSQAEARRMIFDENEDVLEEEIWQTMEDGVVCPTCDSYDGKPLSEVPDDIPAHFNCRCYTRFVPKSWADMLRSGDPGANELALSMDDLGLVPDAMAVRSPKTGELIGRAIVSFDDWKMTRGLNIGGIIR